MENYLSGNYQNYQAFEAEFAKEATNLFKGHTADHRATNKIISYIQINDVNFGAESKRYPVIYFEDGSYLVFNLAVNSGILTLSSKDLLTYTELMSIYNNAIEQHKVELDEAMKQAKIEARRQFELNQQRLREEAAAAEVRKQEEKYQKKINRALKKLDTLKAEDSKKLFNSPTNYYECLGWMVKHATGIRAAMPDYMEAWFVSQFGDVERYVVNSKKKTSGGFDYQWGLGLKISFDKSVSGPLEKKATRQNKKVIDSVSFVWDLIENWGFRFGKEQSLEQIRNEVPSEYLESFDYGYSL